MYAENLSGDMALGSHLNRLADDLPDIIFRRRIWPDEAFEYINAAVMRITGYTPAELYADPCLGPSIVHPDDLPRLMKLAETPDSAVLDYTARWVCKDGSIRHMQHRDRLVRDEVGRPVAVEGVVRDVTDEVNVHTTLHKYQQMLDLASDPIFTWGPDSCLTSWNKGAERLFGWDAADALGKNVHELLHTRFPEPLDAIMQTYLAAGRWEGRLVHTTRDGLQVTVESRWTRQLNADGTVADNLEINHDISERVRLEAELLERERRYRDLYDNSPDMYCLGIPTEDRITDCNQTLLRTLGYIKEELIGKSPSILFAPESFARMLSRLPNFLAARRSDNFEAQMRRKDGALVDVLMSATLEPDPAGGPPTSLATMRDITARKRAEEQQRVLSERLKLALEVASIGVWDSGEQNEGLVWDARMYEMHGIEPATRMTYRQWRQLMHPEDMLPAYKAAMAAIADGTQRLAEYRVMLPDGSIRQIQTIGKALIDGDGRLVRQIGVCMDITERHVRERTRGLLAAIVDSSPDAIVARNVDGVIVSWNAGAEKLYGYTAAEAIGRSVTMLAVQEACGRMVRVMTQTVKGRAIESYDTQHLTKDGRVIEIATTSAPIYDEQGKVLGASSISRDITERKRMERELQENEERFRLMAEIMPSAQVLARLNDGVVLYANTAAGQLTGMLPQQLIGAHSDYFYYLDETKKAEFFTEIHRTGVVRNMDLQVRRPSGDTVWGLASAALVVYHGEEVILSTVLDISERKQAEIALAESEAQLRAIIENTGDSIWSIDRDYRLMAGNSTFDHLITRQMGRTLSVGESVLDVPYPPESKEMWKPLYDRALAGDMVEVQFESALRPGVVLACYLNPIRDTDGNVTGVAGRAVNITVLLRNEAKLRETVQRLALATSAARIGVWNWNFADDRLEWDDRMCEMYAVSDDARSAGLFYDVWRSRVHPDDLAMAEATLTEVVRLNHEWNSEFRIVLPDGSIRHIQASSVVEHDRHGKASRMIGINSDITEQKLYEQVLQDTNAILEQRVSERTAELHEAIEGLKVTERLKDEFLAAMSHELRTPLSGILGAADLLAMELLGPLTARQQLKLTMIQESGARLLKMVNDLLRYAGLTAGKAVPRRERCALDEVGAACISRASRAAASKQLTVEYVICSPAPVIVSDAQAVTELLNELLDNAVKFTPNNGCIGLETSETGDSVQLVVWDTGIGIAPEKLKSVFMPFVQGDGSLTRQYEGIGLGLAFAAKMTEVLGGTIAVESEVGRGSRFTVTLPKE